MRKLLWRLRRWWQSFRIRLPAVPDPRAWQPGDRLQIGSRLWRIEGCSSTAAGRCCELVSGDRFAVRARLRSAEDGWRLSAETGTIELTAEEVLHFPVHRAPHCG